MVFLRWTVSSLRSPAIREPAVEHHVRSRGWGTMSSTDDFRLTKRKKDGICQAILTCKPPAKPGFFFFFLSQLFNHPSRTSIPKQPAAQRYRKQGGVGEHGPWAGCNARGGR